MRAEKLIAVFCLLGALCFFGGCGEKNILEDLPDDPVARAAAVSLLHVYRDSTMWEIRAARVLSSRPMKPSKDFVQQHNPQEVFCVCVEYEARYKVPWAKEDQGKWEKGVHNILVMKTQGGEYMALKPQGLCPVYCY